MAYRNATTGNGESVFYPYLTLAACFGLTGWAMLRHRFIVKRDRLVKVSVLTTTIEFARVTCLCFDATGTILVRSDESKILLDMSIDQQEDLCIEVIERVKNNPGLEITGDQDQIEAFSTFLGK